ncbi:hypothetical protein Goari_000075 [Gossypium aridum]|uniref:RNase H type-1 domain-containing protein n=1 Tax=Gossypium aridum TaxID=34290 RepID=A0A7J8YLJ9_GOSAI|nr:hypothetical protein [Gossypium aridum]
MVVYFFPILEVSWRAKLLGREALNSGRNEDFEFLDGDVVRSMVNGRNMNTCSILLEGWDFLNTDGSVRIKDDFATAGGVGILDGLNILIDHGLDNVMIQSDSLEVVITIQESSTGGSNKALIKKIL